MANEFEGLKTVGSHGALIDGEVVSNLPDSAVYVNSSDDLAGLANSLPIGALAIQYGFVHIWQLKPDRTWIQV